MADPTAICESWGWVEAKVDEAQARRESDQVLEPKLDRESLRVLRAIPASGGEDMAAYRKSMPSIWQIAEALDTTDLNDLKLTLNGLAHLGYVSNARGYRIWWRTQKGDDALGNASSNFSESG